VSLFALLGVGLYYGAREVQDYLERDQLPPVGADVPDFRSTTFQVRSSSPAPTLDGTLVLDRRTRAFEFVGRPSGDQAGIRAMSPDGSTKYIGVEAEGWRIATAADTILSEIQRAMPYLVNVDNVDSVLQNQIRRGYTVLDLQATEGTGDNELIRYEMTIDTDDFSDDYPVQWLEFKREVIPAVPKTRNLPVTMWLDTEEVVVRLRDDATNWAWERLAYSEEAFEPEDPADDVAQSTTTIEGGSDNPDSG
jgi:hypothetical protein